MLSFTEHRRYVDHKITYYYESAPRKLFVILEEFPDAIPSGTFRTMSQVRDSLTDRNVTIIQDDGEL